MKEFFLKYKKFLEYEFEVKPMLRGLPYWVAAAAVGFIAVVYSSFFSYAIDFARHIYQINPYWLFLISPLCFFLGVYLVEKYAPMASGTGVPQVIKAVSLDAKQPDKIHDYLNMRVCIIVILSSLLGMMGGGSLGREGPLVHISACVFYFVGRRFTGILPYTEHRSWIIAGGAAGVAAAFNAPLAGVVFVLEELAQQHFHQFKSVVISATIVAGMVSQWISGKYLYFGYPKIGDVPFSSVIWAILVGVMCGLLAYPFQRLVQIDWRGKFKNYFNTRLKFSIFIGLCVAAIINFVDPSAIGGGVSVIENLLLKEERADWSLLIGRFFGTLVSHLSGIAGGFLAPSLALGAAVGSKVSTLGDYSNHSLLVLVGMSAFLSANLRAPFTAWVVVMEMTDRHEAIFPLMVASLVGYGTMEFLLKLPKNSSKDISKP
jgi:H+/Cl- antiporter ClcA